MPKPYGEYDAKKWAEAFKDQFLRTAVIDDDVLIDWFAAALHTGYERGLQVAAPAPQQPYPPNPPGWQILDG